MPSSNYSTKKRVADRYNVVGFTSSGTYGRVYKAHAKQRPDRKIYARDGREVQAVAIKKFKPDKEGEVQYTGISQSAIREMALCTELAHINVISLVEIILEAKCIFMVFEYADDRERLRVPQLLVDLCGGAVGTVKKGRLASILATVWTEAAPDLVG
ncbi:cyclin-dependent protein kinase, partial [Cryomyces antarcticus]